MKYELFVLLPNLEENEIKAADQEIRKIIEKNNGSVVDFYEFGKRKLSYVIKKIRQGFYLDYAIEIETKDLKSLDRELKLNNLVLRFDIGKLEGELNKVMQEEEGHANSDANKNEYHANDLNNKKEKIKEKEDVKEDVIEEKNKEKVEEKKEEVKKERVDMDELDEKLEELIK
jgi:small subunit ribosomal protein S6